MRKDSDLEESVLRTNLVLTEPMIGMLDAVKRAIGAASRSETIRSLIREKYAQISGADDESEVETAVGTATGPPQGQGAN